MTWTLEDGGPQRRQMAAGGLRLDRGSVLEVTTRVAPAATMAVWDHDGEDLLLLRHSAGDDAVTTVERLDPVTLEVRASSPELAGGPLWPGSIGVGSDGSVHVVFGQHAHRLDPELRPLASRQLPRARPHNGFVPLPDGHLVTKDFAGSRPSHLVPPEEREPCQLLVLDPDRLEIVDSLVLPEPSIARLSADGDLVAVVGDTSLMLVRWDGHRLALEEDRTVRYRTREGQGYGWDCVLAAGCAWFLDDGDGSEAFALSTLRGKGLATAPLQLIRVDLSDGSLAAAEVCGRPGGLIANPPIVDSDRGVAVGYDSGNGVVTAFDSTTLEPRWQRTQDHGGHLVLYPETGELVTGDHADLVVLDVATGTELGRVDAGMGMQSVLFPLPGRDRDVYVCTFLGISRIAVTG